MVGAHCPLVAFHVDLFFSHGLFPRKNDVPKILALLDIWKVPKTKKYAKVGFLFCRVKIKIRRSFRKSPKSL
jgi:hypothetical protein